MRSNAVARSRLPSTLAALAGLALTLGLPAAARAATCAAPQTTTFLGGLADGFVLPTEPASPSAALQALLGSPARAFDDDSPDRSFGHTVTGLPTGISGATLTVSLCAASGGPTNDSLALDLTSSGTFAWSRSLSSLTGKTWLKGDCAELSLDLAALPASSSGVTNILSALADGSLDVFVQDDTTVDFLRLDVQHCPPTPCAPPPDGLDVWWPLDETAGPTAHDVAHHNDGAYTNAPLPVAGKVGGALSFDGIASHLVVPDAPSLDVGASPNGDFSVDFWIKTTQVSFIRSLLDKREEAPSAKGWTVFLVDGELFLQLAEGGSGGCDSSTPSGCTNYGSGVFVADGDWHFVTVTVDREDSAGIRWYLDGSPAGTPSDPTLRADSLENGAPLLIAAHAFDSAFFAGALDEIEIFHRVLAPAEVAALNAAGGDGKCRSHVFQPWDISFCHNFGPAHAQPLLCNDSLVPRTYGLTFQGQPAGPHCSLAGPTVFTLAETQPILVPPGSCTAVHLTIQPPPGMTAGQVACFNIQAEDLTGGQVVTNMTSIWDTGICGFPVLPGTLGNLPNRRTPLDFQLLNPGPTARPLNYDVTAMPSSAGRQLVRLNGLEPGATASGTVNVPARGSARVSVDAQLTDFQPFELQNILLVDRDNGSVLAATGLASFAPGCTADPTTLCLNGGRFRVRATWRDFVGQIGQANAVPLTGDTGYFWFFDPANVELVLKVLDGTALNGQWWVFYGALSSVEYSITVTDTQTGASKSFTNRSGVLASVADTSAIPDIVLPPAAAGPATAPNARPEEVPAAVPSCTPSDTVLCLREGRFRVEADWQIPGGQTGAGHAVAVTRDTGYFWFFDAANVELVLKVLDGTTLNDHWWVFFGALSDVKYTIHVTDTVTGATKTYTNPQGTLASVADVQALPN